MVTATIVDHRLTPESRALNSTETATSGIHTAVMELPLLRGGKEERLASQENLGLLSTEMTTILTAMSTRPLPKDSRVEEN